MNSEFDGGEQPDRGWLGALVNPFFLFQGCIEVFNSWLFTRPWGRIGVGLLVLAMVAVPISLVARGALLGRDELLKRYSLLVDRELRSTAEAEPSAGAQDDKSQRDEPSPGESQAEESPSEPSPSSTPAPLVQDEKTTPYADMLFRRLLRMDDREPRTRYMIALHLTRSGRITQARQLMQELAPADAGGYAPAHAWLAVDLLAHQSGTPEAKALLMHHLSHTLEWDRISGGLLAVYAQLLSSEGKRSEALEVMAKAARKDGNLQSAFVLMARRLNMPKLAEASTAKAKERLLEKVQNAEASEEDFIQLCLLQLTDDEIEAALETAREGLKTQAPESERLKHLASEALRILYRQSIQQNKSGTDLNLALLDEALRMYPANPNLSTEIAQLSEMGIAAPPEFKVALQRQLLSGQATAVAHLILANQELKAGRISDAIPHLEISLRQAPNQPVTLNNLALALALTYRDQLDRAQQLIAKAIAINSRNPQYYDTQGEIYLIAGRPLDAIESLEKAIAIASDRRHTRELMVKAYRAAGLEDLAAQQEAMLVDSQPATALSASPR